MLNEKEVAWGNLENLIEEFTKTNPAISIPENEGLEKRTVVNFCCIFVYAAPLWRHIFQQFLILKLPKVRNPPTFTCVKYFQFVWTF